MKKFWSEIYSETVHYLNLFIYRFQFTFMYHEKSTFSCKSTSLVALIFHHNFAVLIRHLNYYMPSDQVRHIFTKLFREFFQFNEDFPKFSDDICDFCRKLYFCYFSEIFRIFTSCIFQNFCRRLRICRSEW